jgi:hypothetical protein
VVAAELGVALVEGDGEQVAVLGGGCERPVEDGLDLEGGAHATQREVADPHLDGVGNAVGPAGLGGGSDVGPVALRGGEHAPPLPGRVLTAVQADSRVLARRHRDRPAPPVRGHAGGVGAGHRGGRQRDDQSGPLDGDACIGPVDLDELVRAGQREHPAAAAVDHGEVDLATRTDQDLVTAEADATSRGIEAGIMPATGRRCGRSEPPEKLSSVDSDERDTMRCLLLAVPVVDTRRRPSLQKATATLADTTSLDGAELLEWRAPTSWAPWKRPFPRSL